MVYEHKVKKYRISSACEQGILAAAGTSPSEQLGRSYRDSRVLACAYQECSEQCLTHIVTPRQCCIHDDHDQCNSILVKFTR